MRQTMKPFLTIILACTFAVAATGEATGAGSLDLLQSSERDGSLKPRGIVVVSAPSSAQSPATTLHLLETERADRAAVGIAVQPQVAVTIGGVRGWRFDGIATGQYGHTFVPFSGHSCAA